MRTRTGKIARLPGALRHELNHRLHNGAPGREIVPWLNALPEVQRVLAARFASRPITEDNLSEWRQGGFQEWLLQEERRVRLRELSDQCPERDPALRARRLAAFTEEQLALELAEEIERLSAMKDRDARIRNTCNASAANSVVCRTPTPANVKCASSKPNPPPQARRNHDRIVPQSCQNRSLSDLFGLITLWGEGVVAQSCRSFNSKPLKMLKYIHHHRRLFCPTLTAAGIIS